MAQYKTGFASAVNGSPIITGYGTSWVTDGITTAYSFIIALNDGGDGVLYDIASVDTETQITLTANYGGATTVSVAYGVQRDFTTPDNIPEISNGDVGVAGVFTRAMRVIQTKFSALASLAETLTNKTIVVADNTITTAASGTLAATELNAALAELESEKQPVDATLTSLSALGTAADKYAYTTGVDTWAEGSITTAGRAILDDADAAAQRSTLGLGTAAVESIGTSGATVPLLSTANTWSLKQDFSASGITLSKGTFAPTIIGTTTAGTGTYTTQTGQYTEFDDCYAFTIFLEWTAHTGTGSMRIEGMPFTATSSGAISVSNLTGLSTGTAGSQLIVDVISASTQLRFQEINTTTGVITNLTLDTAARTVLSGVIFK